MFLQDLWIKHGPCHNYSPYFSIDPAQKTGTSRVVHHQSVTTVRYSLSLMDSTCFLCLFRPRLPNFRNHTDFLKTSILRSLSLFLSLPPPMSPSTNGTLVTYSTSITITHTNVVTKVLTKLVLSCVLSM